MGGHLPLGTQVQPESQALLLTALLLALLCLLNAFNAFCLFSDALQLFQILDPHRAPGTERPWQFVEISLHRGTPWPLVPLHAQHLLHKAPLGPGPICQMGRLRLL